MLLYLFGLLILLYLIIKVLPGHKGKAVNLPPQVPGAIPVFGHLIYLGHHPAKVFLRWKKLYGSMFLVKLGSFRGLVITDSKIVRKISKPEFFDRAPLATLVAATQNRGMVVADFFGGEQRHFIVKHMQLFTDRGSVVGRNLEDDLPAFLDSLRTKSSELVPITDMFMFLLMNSFWENIMGFKFSHEDPEMVKLARVINRVTYPPSVLESIADFVPWLAHWFPGVLGITSTLTAHKALIMFLEKKIQFRNTSRIKGQPRDLLDAYLDRMDETTDINSTFYPPKNFLPYTMAGFIIAAGETTNAAMEWIMLLLTTFPDVQKKLQAEIAANTNNNSIFPSLQHRPNMPYTQAITTEVFRFTSFFPFGSSHYTKSDSELGGYFIPKDTIILQNSYGIHHDPELWKNPEKFDPERFLDSDGNFVPSEHLVIFGHGKRICLGESFARDQIFLIMTRIFQRFNVSFGPKVPSTQGKFALIMRPEYFEAHFTDRLEGQSNNRF